MKVQIFQEKNPTFHVDENVKVYFASDYKKVYEEENSRESRFVPNDLLEELFERFNCGVKPSSYTGHSMSVGDIVVLDDKAYICDAVGFKKVNLK